MQKMAFNPTVVGIGRVYSAVEDGAATAAGVLAGLKH